MKKIHISNKKVFIIFALKKVLFCGYILLGLLCVFLSLFLDGYTYIGLWWMLGFLLIYVIAKLNKKPTVYLTTAMIGARHYINDAYWLKVAYVKKTAINETVYDVVYFDNDIQVITETLREALFKRKIGENSTHYKATKEKVLTFLEADRISTVATLFQLPFLEIEGEVVLDLSDFSDSYGHSFHCIKQELVQRFEVIRYDQKRINENHIEVIKNCFLEHLVIELNRMNTKYHFEVLTLSPETHKTDTLGESSFREYKFPYIEQPKDETDKMSNAIHTYCTAGADKIEEMARERQDAQKYSIEYIKDVLRPLSNVSFDLWIYAMELRKKNIDILDVEISMVIKHLGIDKQTYYTAMNELAEKDLI